VTGSPILVGRSSGGASPRAGAPRPAAERFAAEMVGVVLAQPSAGCGLIRNQVLR
jgi:hypothetical protein